MTTSYSEEITYKCSNDCRQTGCPGHKLKISHHHTSDTVSIIQDEKVLHTYDKEKWNQLYWLEHRYRQRA